MDWILAQVNRLTKGYVPSPLLRREDEHWNVLLVHAHPVKDSYSSALADATQQGLQDAGHNVTRISLYEMENGQPFQPALTRAEREEYLTVYPKPSKDVEPIVDALRKADALVFVYPTWWFNVPAILKGFFDRSFLPGTAFRFPHLEEGASEKDASSTGLVPNLTNIKKVGCVSTYGATRPIVFLAGDNGRNMISRGFLPLFSNTCTITWMGLYNMDAQSQQRRKDFLDNVRQTFSQF